MPTSTAAPIDLEQGIAAAIHDAVGHHEQHGESGMTYKTILLHVNDERRVAGLVDAAARLASKQEAHVIGLYVLPPVPTYGATTIGAGMIKAGLNTFREEAKRVRAAFEKAVDGRGFGTEWRVVEAKNQGVAETIMNHARSTDLVIASQRDRDWDFATLLDEPERLAIECGRPVLVVPHHKRFASFATRITVAWNGSSESARAVFDSLPLLQAAESVRILSINPHDETREVGAVPTADIVATLERHGVKCTGSKMLAGDAEVGIALLSSVADDKSDLLVMGAYGHSRIREFVFGGTTRHILTHMTVPILMSH
jgi:nucleotide-binding universal stress UspA family protein